MMHIAFQAPSPEEFVQLRCSVGWDPVSIKHAQLALQNSLFHVTVREENKLIGMGRIIGDGSLFFYIQDVVVEPQFQGEGIGHILMCEIETFLNNKALNGATVGLLAAKGKEAFYARYQYIERNGVNLGLGMCKFINT